MSIDTLKALQRRQLAIEIAHEIITDPGYPFCDPIPRVIILAIYNGLERWEKQKP